jgi:hypothetical protein
MNVMKAIAGSAEQFFAMQAHALVVDCASHGVVLDQRIALNTMQTYWDACAQLSVASRSWFIFNARKLKAFRTIPRIGSDGFYVDIVSVRPESVAMVPVIEEVDVDYFDPRDRPKPSRWSRAKVKAKALLRRGG